MEQLNEQNPEMNQEPVMTPPEFNPGVPRPQLTFKEAVKICWSKYSDFTGRARRSEYWWFSLFAFLVMLLPLILLIIGFGMSQGSYEYPRTGWPLFIIGGIVVVILSLIFLVPSLAVTTRRLHDTGHSGWWIIANYAVSFISSFVRSFLIGAGYEDNKLGIVIGLILGLINFGIGLTMFIFMLLDSHKGENQYGPSPKYQ